MVFAESHDAVWLALFDTVYKVAGILSPVVLAYVAYLTLKTKASVRESGEENKAAVAEAKKASDEAKTAAIVAGRTTLGRIGEVKTALDKKSEATAQVRNAVNDVMAAIEKNTAITSTVKDLVNGDRDKILTHVRALQELMENHGIECPPHPKKEGEESP